MTNQSPIRPWGGKAPDSGDRALEPGYRIRRLGAMRFAVVILMMVCVVACGPSPAATAGETGTLEVSVVAGPICPVETQEPDPACEPRPVAGAQLVVSPGDGTEVVVAQATSDADGVASFELAPGTYIVTGAEAAGLFGVPDPAVAEVVGGETTSLTLAYDTGIR